MKPQIIALAGKAGSGKDTVAHYLWHLTPSAGCFAFAEPIKQMLAEGFDLHFSTMSREEKEAVVPWLGVSPRVLAQTLGTEWGRSVCEDIWIRCLEQRLQKLGVHFGPVIITDCRFPNEAAWVRQRGGVVWWVERTGVAPVAAHASEKSLSAPDCDRTIANLGTLDDLGESVRRAWEQLKAERSVA